MSLLALNQFLTLLNWFVLATLLAILLLIARFYQRFSAQHTYFGGFVVVVVLFGVAAIRAASHNTSDVDVTGAVCSALGGILLSALSLNLGWRMLRNTAETMQDGPRL
jgi:hypothetical protein